MTTETNVQTFIHKRGTHRLQYNMGGGAIDSEKMNVFSVSATGL